MKKLLNGCRSAVSHPAFPVVWVVLTVTLMAVLIAADQTARLAVMLVLALMSWTMFKKWQYGCLDDGGAYPVYVLLSSIFEDRTSGIPIARCKYPGIEPQGMIRVLTIICEKRGNTGWDLDTLKARLQGEIDARILRGAALGVPALNSDGSLPGIQILHVTETTKGYCLCGVYPRSSEEWRAYHAMCARQDYCDTLDLLATDETPDDDEF